MAKAKPAEPYIPKLKTMSDLEYWIRDLGIVDAMNIMGLARMKQVSALRQMRQEAYENFDWPDNCRMVQACTVAILIRTMIEKGMIQ